MKLSLEGIKDTESYKKANISLPQYDIEKLREKTLVNPGWLHFGGGNIFRAFVASALQDAIESGRADTGVIVAETFDYEQIDRYYNVYDNLSLSVIMKPNGEFDKKVVGSICGAYKGDVKSDDFRQIKKIAKSQSLKMISFTITEKGYALKDYKGEFLPYVINDIENGPETTTHTMGILTSLLLDRYNQGKLKLSVVSMDNCSHNSDKIKNAVKIIANEWLKRGFVDADFVSYVTNDNYISYPITMIDKITPRPSENIKSAIEDIGMEDMELIVTEKGSYTAPFVNAEMCEYLIIEDNFANGKIDISKDNVIFTDRETVNKVETMKVTTCLNPNHTALAVTGCLLGYTTIADEMKDELLVKLIKKIGYDEGMKVVVDPGILNPKGFIDEVFNQRFANPYIPDTPQRIAMDTSQKVAIRFGETIKAYDKSSDLAASDLVGIPLAIAAWCRYLVGINDMGEKFELSLDPQLDQLKAIIGDVKIGDTADLSNLLLNADIFGVDLFEVGLGEKIQCYFNEMLQEVGAVRRTLDKYL